MLVNSAIRTKLFCQPVSDTGDGESSYEDGWETRADDLGVGDTRQQDWVEGGANGVEENFIKNLANDKAFHDLAVLIR